MKLNIITQESNYWSNLDHAQLSQELDNILNVAESQLSSQNAASSVVTGTDELLAYINPRQLLNADSSQAHQDGIEPGTASGSRLHQLNTEQYYSPQNTLDSQSFFYPPTEPNNDLWDSVLDVRLPFEVNITILHQKFAHPSSRVPTLILRLSERFKGPPRVISPRPWADKLPMPLTMPHISSPQRNLHHRRYRRARHLISPHLHHIQEGSPK